jgi:hypothetical protein
MRTDCARSWIYEYNEQPKKIVNTPKLLKKWKGREGELLVEVEGIKINFRESYEPKTYFLISYFHVKVHSPRTIHIQF